jgi:pSer/pThr/pTyr-binding forkhead associated (FHA) protein
MKTFSIGRDLNCDIVMNDSTDVISRRHALLNVMPSGKMTIIDQSSNGTYVNGIRISQNVPVPVTRKDTISFAHVAKLDWNLVPKSNQWMIWLIGGFIALIVLLGIFFGAKSLNSSKDANPDGTEAVANDSIAKAQEAAKQDSIKKAEQDSIAKVARQDSINKAKAAQKQKAEAPKKQKPATETKKPEQKQPEQKQPETKKPTRVAG